MVTLKRLLNGAYNIIAMAKEMHNIDDRGLAIRLVKEFGDRKKPGRLSVVTNLNDNNKIYPVPHNKEHIDIYESLECDVRKWGRLIPSHIYYSYLEFTDNYFIKSLETGISGVELGYGLTHNNSDLVEGHHLVLNFINNGEIPIDPNFSDKISY